MTGALQRDFSNWRPKLSLRHSKVARSLPDFSMTLVNVHLDLSFYSSESVSVCETPRSIGVACERNKKELVGRRDRRKRQPEDLFVIAVIT